MGRKKLWPERTAIKFPAGTFERIAAILDEGEDRMTFMPRQWSARSNAGRPPASARSQTAGADATVSGGNNE
jgi:hypothetical protein